MGDENNEGILEGKGVVKFFKDAQGYGFIFVADNEWRQTDDQVFVHQTKITMEGRRTLYENQHVYMKYQMEQKGYKATEVTPDEVWMEENKDYIEQQKRKQQGMQGGNFRGRDRGGYDDRYGGGGSYGSHGGYDDRYNSQYGGGRRYEQEYHDNRGGGYHGYGGGDYGHGHY